MIIIFFWIIMSCPYICLVNERCRECATYHQNILKVNERGGIQLPELGGNARIINKVDQLLLRIQLQQFVLTKKNRVAVRDAGIKLFLFLVILVKVSGNDTFLQGPLVRLCLFFFGRFNALKKIQSESVCFQGYLVRLSLFLRRFSKAQSVLRRFGQTQSVILGSFSQTLSVFQGDRLRVQTLILF